MQTEETEEKKTSAFESRYKEQSKCNAEKHSVSVTSVVGQDHLRNFQLNGCQGNYSTSFLA